MAPILVWTGGLGYRIWAEVAFSGTEHADMATGLLEKNNPSSVQIRFLKPLAYAKNKQSMAPILEWTGGLGYRIWTEAAFSGTKHADMEWRPV